MEMNADSRFQSASDFCLQAALARAGRASYQERNTGCLCGPARPLCGLFLRRCDFAERTVIIPLTQCQRDNPRTNPIPFSTTSATVERTTINDEGRWLLGRSRLWPVTRASVETKIGGTSHAPGSSVLPNEPRTLLFSIATPALPTNSLRQPAHSRMPRENKPSMISRRLPPQRRFVPTPRFYRTNPRRPPDDERTTPSYNPVV